MNANPKVTTEKFVVLTPTGSTGTSSSVMTTTAGASRDAAVPSNKDIESAVYAHIQAVRALGRTHINPTEIAAALGLSERQVLSTLSALRSKGVKVVHG
jgi:hypothetical protein